MNMRDGERQVATTLEGIRRDHRARYEFAASLLQPGSAVIDFACGVGYGCHILATAGYKVTGRDIDGDAIAYAWDHFARSGSKFGIDDARDPHIGGEFDAAISFETIEHIEDPRPLLKALRASAPLLYASVPNEDRFPFSGHAYHFRHYTRAQFHALLQECGWMPVSWWGQEGPHSEVERDVNGRTLIAVCQRCEPVEQSKPDPNDWTTKHVAILGMGPSLNAFTEITKRTGGASGFCDEVWGINAVGNVMDCHRIFHMDDVRIQEIRVKARPASNIAKMLAWMRTHPGPIYTSRAHPDYPGLVEYPLADVLNECSRQGYLNSTAAYAVALAVAMRVKRISVFGCDYTYPNAHDAEKGRACMEFWLGMGVARGIEIRIPHVSSLMDGVYSQADRLYGYDTVDVKLDELDGKLVTSFVERATLPTADEIEAKYDHSEHPNPLVNGTST